MFKPVVLLALLGVSFGAPQSKSLVPMLGGRNLVREDADISEYPYTISVVRNSMHVCGGALISTTWVASTARCVNPMLIYQVRGGSTNRGFGGVLVNVQTIIVHPDYNVLTINNDIVLLQLASAVNHPNAIPIVLAPEGDAPQAGFTATITGWEPRSTPDTLQAVKVPVVSQAECLATCQQSVIADTLFCVGYENYFGNAGGPVVVNDILVGLESWTPECANPDIGGMTSISSLRSWIREQTGI